MTVKTTHSGEEYTKLYILEIIRLLGDPLYIIINSGSRFTYKFFEIVSEMSWY